MSFRAFRIEQEEREATGKFVQLELDDLTPGEVIIKVNFSGINYKDFLAVSGKAKIVKNKSLNGGIDLSGIVESSSDDSFEKGDKVLVCGCGLSEIRDGGFSEKARVPANCVVKLPNALDLKEAMAIGTAGLTAALALIKLEINGQKPDMGPIAVTGATGGVGSLAIDLLAGKGFEVTGITSRLNKASYLFDLGASHVLDSKECEVGSRPLEKGVWGGAIDNLGGDTLSWLSRSVKSSGNIAVIGNVSGINLNMTVLPLILRGVSLLGINSVDIPVKMRNLAWERLASDLKPKFLDHIVSKIISFDELPNALDGYALESSYGRTIVKISN